MGLWVADGSRYRLLALPDMDALRQASLLLVFAFGGFENASVPSEEVRNPRRNLPLALLAATFLTALLYVLIQVVALGTLPGLATDPTPLASAGSLFLGPRGGLLIALGAVVSTTGSMSALILVGPRILYALAHGGQIPAALGRIHPAYRTPHVSVIVFTALVWAIALAGSFALLVAVSAIARLLFGATTCLAVPVLRRRAGAPRGFAVPGGPLVPVAAAAVSLWLLAGLTRMQAQAGAAALLAGALVFGLGRRPDRG